MFPLSQVASMTFCSMHATLQLLCQDSVEHRLGFTVLSYHFLCWSFLRLQCSEVPLCKHKQLGNHPARVERLFAGLPASPIFRTACDANLENSVAGVGPVGVLSGHRRRYGG